MKRRYILLFFSLLGFGFVLPAFGQEQAISREQYFAAYHAANTKSDASFPRKEIIFMEWFEKNQSIRKKDDIYEYASANSWIRTIEVTEKGNKKTSKYLRIGDLYYCQEGANPFKKSTDPCGSIIMGMSPDPDTQKFSVNKITLGNEVLSVYRMYTLRSFARSSKDKTKVFSFEQIFSVRPDGRFAGFDIKNGIESEPKEMSSWTTIRYEYDVTIPKIEAPIK